MDAEIKISVSDDQSVTGLRNYSEGSEWTVIYAPGARSNNDDPFGKYLADRLPSEGVSLFRFQFPYMERGDEMPDEPEVLQSTWRAVIAEFGRDGRVALSGRSRGGRVASEVVPMDGSVCDSLILFAYPLHTPGEPDQLRVDHLPDVSVPTLFCSGTRDAWGTPDELKRAAGLIPGSSSTTLDGADYAFLPEDSRVRTQEDVWAEAVGVALKHFGVG
jgi:predicted alpha/beta-hydrolase family hydrolase